MIASVRGTLLEKAIDHVVIEVGGVGLEVAVSLNTLSALPPAGQPAYLRTYLQVREDALTLFGFASVEERSAFELCTSVQGIGAKTAMSILSSLAPEELARAVRSEDVARLKKVPGVGMKTAERLVLELRDKLDRAGLSARGEPPPAEKPSGKLAAQVSSALVNLGYRPAEAERAAETVSGESPQASVANLLKRALRTLAE